MSHKVKVSVNKGKNSLSGRITKENLKKESKVKDKKPGHN